MHDVDDEEFKMLKKIYECEVKIVVGDDEYIAKQSFIEKDKKIVRYFEKNGKEEDILIFSEIFNLLDIKVPIF